MLMQNIDRFKAFVLAEPFDDGNVVFEPHGVV
jgi:hypothetical protein